MSDAVSTKNSYQASTGRSSGRNGRRWFRLGVVVGALALIGGGVGGAWYFGALPAGLLFGGAEVPSPPGPASPSAILIEIPDIIANLNAGGRPVFVKIRAQVELARPADAAAARAAMPRLLDMFNTFLRETRPEELRGSTGVHRLREELVSRANIILRDGAVTDVLFLEIVVQ